jgi:GAF domain-containing protein
LLGRHGSVAASVGDGEVRTGDKPSAELREDPALIAAAEGSTVLVPDTAAEPRWPVFAAQAAARGIRSSLSIGLMADGAPLGALTLHAGHPDAFDEAAQFAASMLAVHVGIALGQLRVVQNLRVGMASREVIGQAIGVLVERRRITSAQAFELLVRASQHNNVKLRDIASLVVETGQDPAQLRSR